MPVPANTSITRHALCGVACRRLSITSKILAEAKSSCGSAKQVCYLLLYPSALRQQMITTYTGWPGAGGTTRGKAFVEAEGQDSTNANKYFQNAICPLMNNFHYNVFYFEAFDEPNKKPEGETTIYSANHWGMMSTNTDTASGSLEVKPGFTPKCSGGGTQQRQSKRRLPPAAVAMPTDAPQMMAM